jgi:hypothetical protein
MIGKQHFNSMRPKGKSFPSRQGQNLIKTSLEFDHTVLFSVKENNSTHGA